jgi:hypothetical protein
MNIRYAAHKGISSREGYGGRNGILAIHSELGREEFEVRIIRSTPKRFEVELIHDIRLPKGICQKGRRVLVPKYSIKLEES